MSACRAVALEVLRLAKRRQGYAQELLEAHCDDLSPADRRLTYTLVLGTIRRVATLDALIRPFLTKPIADMHPDTLDLLRLGAYQLVLLDGIPAHAAVHETVELTPDVVKKFVNAILRKVAGVVTCDWADDVGSNAVPTERGNYRLLHEPLLPHPFDEPLEYLSAAFSFPHWLMERWITRFGPRECVRLGFWFNDPPPIWLRINTNVVNRADILSRISGEAGEHPQSIRLTENMAIRDIPGFANGHFAVQDHSSMLVASALNPQPGWHVLDLCAAPGGKTTHLAELMRQQGKITACDLVPERLQTVTSLCQQLGTKIVTTVPIPEGTPAPMGPFDSALVDAPCSNTGVLGRRPEVRWRIRPEEFAHLAKLQTKLLNDAMDRVRPGGVVVYSTCSIEPDENEGVVQAVLKSRTDWKLAKEHTSKPGQPSDGGYWARLELKG